MNPLSKDRRFLAVFAFVAFLSVMAYVAAVTFLPIPSTGSKFADIAVPSLLSGVIGAVMGYLFGASHVPGGTQVNVPDPAAPTTVKVEQ